MQFQRCQIEQLEEEKRKLKAHLEVAHKALELLDLPRDMEEQVLKDAKEECLKDASDPRVRHIIRDIKMFG